MYFDDGKSYEKINDNQKAVSSVESLHGNLFEWTFHKISKNQTMAEFMH